MSYKTEANASQSAKSNRLISNAGGGSHSKPVGDNARVPPAGIAQKFADGGMVEGEPSMGRLDRPARKGKGATTVNVNIISPQKDAAPPMPPMMPPPDAAAPPMAGPPPGPPPGPGGPGGGMPMPPMGRKSGGRVFSQPDDGAGSGPGRLEKIKDYGAKAGKPAKSPKGD